MTTATRVALRTLRARHGLVAVAALVLVLVGAAGAFAYWTTTGSGGSTASAASLGAPANVTADASGGTVTVAWTGVTPPGASVTGYYVTRYAGSTPSDACGTAPGSTGTYVAAGTLTCDDTGVANGTYTYRVTAVFRTWTAQSASSGSVVVLADATPPTQALSLTSGPGTAHLDGTTIYYRSDVAGSFTLATALTDTGSGPASASFPALSSNGWSHTAADPTTGSGSAPTVTYQGGTYSWASGATSPGTHTVTGRDVVGNEVTTNLSFVSDVTAPTGGALTVDGTDATGTGASSYSTTGTFTGSFTTFTDGGSGVDPVSGTRITREVGTLSNDTCVGYGTPADVTFVSEIGLATGCYRYTVIGTDRVGNATTLSVEIKVDRDAPTQALAEAGAYAHLSGPTLYFNNNVSGSFTLVDTVTDGGVGPATVTFPHVAASGWDHAGETVSPSGGTLPDLTFPSSSFSWTAGATAPVTYDVTATDAVGNTSTSALSFVADVDGPTGGALSVAGTVATSTGSYLQTTTGATWTINRTDFDADAGSGFVSSVLTRSFASQASGCATWQAAITISGTTDAAHTAGGCYRYTLTGTDNVGNTSSRTVTMITFGDTTAPSQSLSAIGNAYITGTTLYYRSGQAGSFVIVATVTDNQSGPAQVQFGLSNGTGSFIHNQEYVTNGVGTHPTLVFTSSPYSWTAANPSVPNANARSVRAYDNAYNNTGLVQLTYTADASVPTGGSLNVNGTAATAGGSTSSTVTGSYTITRTDYNADTGSGVASSELTREFAPLNAGSCTGVTFGASSVVVGAPDETDLVEGCYRYTLTGTDRVGNATSIRTTVSVVPGVLTQSLALTQLTGRAVLIDDTVYYNPTTAGSFSLTSNLTGVGANPSQVTFPAIGTPRWTKNANTDNTGSGPLPTQAFTSNTFSWMTNPTEPGAYTVTGRNAFGNTVASTITFNADNAAPTTTLTVDGFGGTTGGVTNYNYGAGSYSVLAAAADARSGVATTTLTRATGTLSNGACSGFGAASAFTGTSESNLPTGCYRYSFTATDNVGNVSTAVVATVMVDRTAPTVTFTGENGSASYLSGNTLYFDNTAAGSFTLVATVTDAHSAPQSASFPDIATADWTHAAETVSPGVGTAPSRTFTSSAYSWEAGAAVPTDVTARTVTGEDLFGNSASSPPLMFVTDSSVPTGGALTVNGTAATAAGSTSNLNSAAPAISVNSRTNYNADTGSGVASSVLTYATASWNGTSCGTFGSETTVTGTTGVNPATGGTCYRYTLTGTDNVGNSSSISTTVRVNLQVRSVVLANGGGGTSGTINRGDTITVQFTGPLAISSLCSTWSGDTANQSITGNNAVGVTIQEGTTTNDYVTVSTTGACGNDFNFGRIVLGADGYLTATSIQTFRGAGANASTISYNASTYTLVITLGRNETTPGDDGSNNVAANSVATYTPDAALTGIGGLPITGTGSTANVRQF